MHLRKNNPRIAAQTLALFAAGAACCLLAWQTQAQPAPESVISPATDASVSSLLPDMQAKSRHGANIPTFSASIPSLFFTQQDMTAIHRSVEIYMKYGIKEHPSDSEDFLNQLDGKDNNKQAEVKRIYTYPQFFLESLAYHSPDAWAIRINGQQINQKTQSGFGGALKVVSIDADKATIEWSMSQDDIDKHRVLAKETPGEFVTMDYATGKATFTLHANQTFSSYNLQVLEGRVKPVSVQNNASNTPNLNTPAPVNPIDPAQLEMDGVPPNGN